MSDEATRRGGDEATRRVVTTLVVQEARRRRGDEACSNDFSRQGSKAVLCPGLFALALDRASAHPCLAHPSGVSRTLPHYIKHTEVERVQVDPLPIL